MTAPPDRPATGLLRRFAGPPPRRPPSLEAQVLEEVDCGAYVREKVVYSTTPGVQVTAYLCLPKTDRRRPAVLCHHQHAGNFALGKSEPVGIEGDPDLAYAAELATEGFVTLSPDAIGFEERNWSPDGRENVGWFELSCRLMQGRTLLADCLHETTIALDYLQTRPEVDPVRLGFIGHSYGGRMAIYVPAYDHRIRASVSNCQCIPYRMVFTPDAGLQAEFVLPGFAVEHDIEDLFADYADTTSLLMSVGTSDKWSRGYAEVFAKARRVLGPRATLDAYDIGHAFTPSMRRAAYDFLTTELGGVGSVSGQHP